MRLAMVGIAVGLLGCARASEPTEPSAEEAPPPIEIVVEEHVEVADR